MDERHIFSGPRVIQYLQILNVVPATPSICCYIRLTSAVTSSHISASYGRILYLKPVVIIAHIVKWIVPCNVNYPQCNVHSLYRRIGRRGRSVLIN